MALTTTTAFTNYLNTYVDMTSGDGGSAVTFSGTPSNEGTLDIGNTTLSAPTKVSVTTLASSGTLILQGNAASDASLQFGSGGVTSIAHGGTLELDGSQAVVTTSGGASSALLGLATNYGALTSTRQQPRRGWREPHDNNVLHQLSQCPV